MKLVNTTYKSTEDMNNELQELKGKTKLKIYKNISNYYDEMKHNKFQSQEDPFSENARSINKVYHNVLLLMKFLRTKPQIKHMNINSFDLYYTVIKNRDEIKVGDNDNDYNNFNGFITPNHYFGIKPRETILR